MSSEDRKPSEIKEEGRDWLLCGLEECEDRLSPYIEENSVFDPKSMGTEKLKGYEDPKVEEIDRRAIEDGYLSGKWEASILPENIDEVWRDIRELVEENKLWGAQVTTKWIREKRNQDSHTVRVYTPNFLDENDVLRVGKLLKKRCDIEKKIKYKPDIYNVLQIYSKEGEDMKLPREIRYEL